MNVEEITPIIGSSITGVDVTTLTTDEFAEIHGVWIERGVIRIRDQELDDDALMAFSRRFGPLERMPTGNMTEAQIEAHLRARGLTNVYVTVISNIVENGARLGGLRNAEAEWHSDMTYVETPPTASLLYAIEVPEQGGDTHFASQWAALASIPADLRARVDDLSIKHDAAHTSVGDLRPGHVEPASPLEAPGWAHPIIRRHPENGRDALYLGRRDWAHVPGLDVDESEALLDELWSYAALPENCMTQHWHEGDLVVWDNRSVLHRRDGFPADQRRMMHRCQVLAA